MRLAVGGDVFDQSLTETTAHLAILDAVSHDLSAGLVAATGLSAYRNARREGRSLFDQAEAVNRTLMDQLGGETFATGVLADDTTILLAHWTREGQARMEWGPLGR